MVEDLDDLESDVEELGKEILNSQEGEDVSRKSMWNFIDAIYAGTVTNLINQL